MCGAKGLVWIKFKELARNKPYRIIDCNSQVSKFDNTKKTLILQLEDGSWVTLPSRFGTLPEEDIQILKSRKIFVINKGPKGQTHIVEFINEDNLQQQQEYH